MFDSNVLFSCLYEGFYLLYGEMEKDDQIVIVDESMDAVLSQNIELHFKFIVVMGWERSWTLWDLIFMSSSIPRSMIELSVGVTLVAHQSLFYLFVLGSNTTWKPCMSQNFKIHNNWLLILVMG